MDNRSICLFSLLSLLGICLSPHQLAAQSLTETTNNSPNIYEDDRIKVAIQSCSRKLQDLTCQAILISKNSDRTIDLNGKNIKLVDFEGNEYYPSNLRLANRISENNLIRTELIENVPFKASFVFTKIPANVTKVALLQIPLGGNINTTAKFRNLVTTGLSSALSGSKPAESSGSRATATTIDRNSAELTEINVPAAKSTTISPEANNNSLICPDPTKVLYRATSKHFLMYICGIKNPTYYVGLAKDGSQGITLRLRYYDHAQFSADNGDTNYTIAANRLTIRKDSKVMYQEKIQVLQSLPGTNIAEDSNPKPSPKKHPATATNHPNQKRNSTVQSPPKIKRRSVTSE